MPTRKHYVLNMPNGFGGTARYHGEAASRMLFELITAWRRPARTAIPASRVSLPPLPMRVRHNVAYFRKLLEYARLNQYPPPAGVTISMSRVSKVRTRRWIHSFR